MRDGVGLVVTFLSIKSRLGLGADARNKELILKKKKYSCYSCVIYLVIFNVDKKMRF